MLVAGAARIYSTLTFQNCWAGQRQRAFGTHELTPSGHVCAIVFEVAGCPNLQHIDLSDLRAGQRQRANEPVSSCLLVVEVAGRPNLQHIDLSKLLGRSATKGLRVIELQGCPNLATHQPWRLQQAQREDWRWRPDPGPRGPGARALRTPSP